MEKRAAVLGIFIVAGLFALAGSASAADIYITQAATGSDTGSGCANAHSASWFNANAAGGNTYHLCGTFTGTAGSTMLTVPASGSPGNPLIILFEQGSIMNSPYWGPNGAVYINKKSHIVIDGGTDGVIKNTEDGTALAYQQASQGIYIANSNNIEIRKLVIQDIYANLGTDSSAGDTGGIETSDIWLNGPCSDISIHDNILNNARAGIRFSYTGVSENIQVFSNTIVDHCWGIAMGSSSGTPQITNVEIHDNDISDWLNWQFPTSSYHTDGIILWQTQGGYFSPKIYNNYVHGDLGGGSATAYIYVTYGITTNPPSDVNGGALIYNNLLVNDGTHDTWILSTGTHTTGHAIYNNILVGRSGSGGTAMMLSGSNITLNNNIVANARVAVGSYDTLPEAVASSDNNIWYNINSGNINGIFGGNDGTDWYSWSQWQGFGYGNQSFLTNPDLGSAYHPQSGSPAIDAGTDLSAYFTTDKDGITRPQDSGWDIGAYEYVSGTGSSCSSADENGDGTVSTGELTSYISKWKQGNVAIGELINAISEWKNGC